MPGQCLEQGDIEWQHSSTIRRFCLPVLFALLIVAVAFGVFVLRRVAPLREDERDDFNAVQGATLTLLALLIGFSISMAVNPL